MILCVGEAYYSNDNEGYVKGSIRTFVNYTAANLEHSCTVPAEYKINPLAAGKHGMS